MKPSSLVIAILASCAVGSLSQPVDAAASKAAVQGRTWAEVARLPDFTTGIWEIGMGPGSFAPGTQPAFTPAYAAKLKAYQDLQKAGDAQDSPSANCQPPGMPGVMGQPYPMQIMYGPGQISIQLEAYMQMRHIYTDGRSHPADPNLTYNGDSIGHWDGDTLVVETSIDDPEALTQPWTSSRTFKRHRDWTIAEYVCEQNNRNLVDDNGHAGIVLTPPTQ